MTAGLRFAMLLVCCLLHLEPAMASSCEQLKSRFSLWAAPQDCVCDERLANLSATLKPPLKIVAACDLWWDNGKKVDLSREKVSLNKYPKKNIHGSLFIEGKMRVSGPFFYEANDAGGFSYLITFDSLVSPKNEFLYSLLGDIDFLHDSASERFRVPPEPANSSEDYCVTANAKVDIDGLRIIIGDTDEAGAYPVSYKVVEVSKFSKCAKK
jgi:hypothetical protein